MTRHQARQRQKRERLIIIPLQIACLMMAAFLSWWILASPNRARVALQRARIALAHARPAQALRLIEPVLDKRPEDVNAMSIRAEAEMMSKRPNACRKTLERLVKTRPENLETWRRLARACLTAHDYPKAENALLRMSEISRPGRQEALAELGQMYACLGLQRQAAEVFRELMTLGDPISASHLAAMGRAFEVLAESDLARRCLDEIPVSAPEYAGAQVLLARIEEREGQHEQAKGRLQELVKDPNGLPAAVRALSGLNVLNGRDRELIRWCDEDLDAARLPKALEAVWQRFRAGLASSDRDWRGALTSLDRIAELDPNSVGVHGARIAILARLGQPERAGRILRSEPGLSASGLGRLSAIVADVGTPSVGQDVAQRGGLHPALTAFLHAVIQRDLRTARWAARDLSPHPTLYRSDLMVFLDGIEPDASGAEKPCRQFATALLASACGLPHLCVELCHQITAKTPDMILAHALCAWTQLNSGESIEPMLDRVCRALPSSGLAKHLTAKQKADREDYAGAIADLQALVRREPDNTHLRHTLSQLLSQAGRVDQAITVLEQLRVAPGPYQVPAANALACLLARHPPDRLDQAYRAAGEALRQAPTDKAVLDTFGWIEHLRGDDERAVKILSLAVYGPNPNAEAHYHLGAAYSGLGNATWARYHLQQAIDSSRDTNLTNEASVLLANCEEQTPQTELASTAADAARHPSAPQ